MRKRLEVDRYTKIVLTLVVILLAALLCKPLFVARPVAGLNGFGLLGKGLAEAVKSWNVYYLGLTNEEILVALEKEWADLQKKVSETTPDIKKEFEITDDELKELAEMTYDELKDREKIIQVNIILWKLYAEGYRIKFATNDFIILER